MRVVLRQLVSLVALVALVGGMARVQPCMDDDDCATSCSSAAAPSCAAADAHHDDPKGATCSCDCLCHVPAVPVKAAAIVRPEAPRALEPAPHGASSCLGIPDPFFRPPRA